MRIESCVTSISWIPSEAIDGLPKLPFSARFTHYDDPPPDDIGDPGADTLERLRDADRFRFANRLRAWVEVDDDGSIALYGYGGGGMIGHTRLNVGSSTWAVQAAPLPDIQIEPEVGDGWVRFTQTAGGRTGVPAPRTVRRPPFVQWYAPIAWTTLSLVIHADGRSEATLPGASPFPRHWIYGPDGSLVGKSGTTDFTSWYHEAFGKHTPWGDEDSPALTTAVETALERQLSLVIMRGDEEPDVTRLQEGEKLTEQGAQSDEIFLLLDGVLSVEVDGEELAQLGPGSVVGERAVLEGGRRTSTLRAVTPCRVAVAYPDQLDPAALEELRTGHRREEA